MHGSTQAMVDYLVEKLVEKDIMVKLFNLSKSDIGELAISLVDAKTIVLGSPTILGGAHPKVIYAAYITNALKPKARCVSIIGSFSWGGKMVEQLLGLIPNLEADILDPVIVKGFPTSNDYQALDKLAESIAKKHKKL